jgi:hypothetical protein
MRAFKEKKENKKKLKDKILLKVLSDKDFDKKNFYFKMLEREKKEFLKKLENDLKEGVVKTLF